jgi:hypothetical protein
LGHYGSRKTSSLKSFKAEKEFEMPKKLKMVVTVFFVTISAIGFSLSKLAFKNVF